MQALYQLAALGVTLLIAIVGGTLTGLLLRTSIFGKVPEEQHFEDEFLWEVPEEDQCPHIKQKSSEVGTSNRTFDLEMTDGDKVSPRGQGM
jgi:ammonium transporter Rh